MTTNVPTGTILLRRGPTTDRLAFVPLLGEIIYDSTSKEVFVGDGETYGGLKVSQDVFIDPDTGELINIPIENLQANTISGILLGADLPDLTISSGLTGGSYNGSAAVTIAVDSSSANEFNKIVVRDAEGNFSAGTITAELNGNASTVTNGVYSSESYADPSWITSLSETKVLPSQTGNQGKYLTTNGSETGWVSPAAAGLPNVVGVEGKFLSTNGSDIFWSNNIQALFEKVGLVTSSPPAVAALDVSTNAVKYYVVATTAPFAVNIISSGSESLGSILEVGRSVTSALIVNCGNSAHYVQSVQIDGTTVGVNVKWQGAITPGSGSANFLDVYTFTVIRTELSEYTVLASQTRFG